MCCYGLSKKTDFMFWFRLAPASNNDSAWFECQDDDRFNAMVDEGFRSLHTFMVNVLSWNPIGVVVKEASVINPRYSNQTKYTVFVCS